MSGSKGSAPHPDTRPAGARPPWPEAREDAGKEKKEKNEAYRPRSPAEYPSSRAAGGHLRAAFHRSSNTIRNFAGPPPQSRRAAVAEAEALTAGRLAMATPRALDEESASQRISVASVARRNRSGTVVNLIRAADRDGDGEVSVAEARPPAPGLQKGVYPTSDVVPRATRRWRRQSGRRSLRCARRRSSSLPSS